MKRQTDVSRLRPAAIQGSHETSARSASCDATVERATALLVHSMQQSDSPIAELSNALARMARTLNDIGTPLFGTAAAPAAPHLQVFHDSLARDIAVCIQSLQFHDRLMQQLSQARDLLTRCAPNSLLAPVQGMAANEGSIELF